MSHAPQAQWAVAALEVKYRANIVLTFVGASMQVAIRKMGNSHGVAIPKPVLQELGLSDVLDMQIKNGVIELRPIVKNPREAWARDAQRIANEGDDALVWPDFANASDAELKW